MSSTSILLDQRSNRMNLQLTVKQLYILLWKSAIVRKVHYISTFFEVIGPILILWGILLFFGKVSDLSGGNNHLTFASIQKNETIYPNPIMSLLFNKDDNKVFKVYYWPNDSIPRKLTQELGEFHYNPILVESEEMIIKEILNSSDVHSIHTGNMPIGVNFQGTDEEKLKYKIFLQPGLTKINAFPEKSNQRPIEYDIKSDFNLIIVKLMSVIDRIFLKHFTKLNITIDKISLNRMPYPKYEIDENPNLGQFAVYDLLALCIMSMYTLVCPLIVKRITDEKSTKSKELMRMIGMSDFIFWSSHFINHLIVLLIHFPIFVFLLCYYGDKLIYYSSPVLCFFIFLLFGIQMILFSMLITTVFNRPNLAVIIAVVIWTVSGVLVFSHLPSIDKKNIGNVGYSFRIFTSFLPTGTVFWLISIMGTFEELKDGLDFTNLNSKTKQYGDFTEITAIMLVICSYPIYIFLIWYIDNVWPFQHGVPRSPIFIFDCNYWFPKRENVAIRKPENSTDTFEPDPKGLQPDIEIHNVTKVFGGFLSPVKTAVDHLWLNIYKNQLTVLLGHNGAGKSTLMNMITGMFVPSSGEIYVNGYNIVTNTNEARRSIGLCPQENILFKELTVYQHLVLFATLKDCPKSLVKSETKSILEKLQLEDKANENAFNLSGGMKRKLQLGLALIGQTNILILDEPTSGLDPEARRVIWDYLISLRREKTILLTTHFMEEADVLGDRIGIMSQGKLSCCGSPYFLKNVFGTGYQLRIEKDSNFDSGIFLDVLRSHVGGTKLKSEMETEVIFDFNQNPNDKQKLIEIFPDLFRDIEANRSEYGISSFGLSYSTLEDVFLAVDSHNPIPFDQSDISEYTTHSSSRALELTSKSQLLKGSFLLFSQFTGLMMKRFHFARRYWQIAVLQLLIPSIVLVFALLITKRSNTSKDQSIELNLETLYGVNTKSYYQGSESCFEAYRRINAKYSNQVYRVNSSEDFASYILEKNPNVNDYITSSVYGLRCFENSSFDIWFNPEQTYSLSLSLIIFFKTLMGLDPNSENSINVDFRPLTLLDNPDTDLQHIFDILTRWTMTCLVMLPIAFPFLAASYALYPIQERVSKSKLIQIMTGLSPTLFWICNFIFDLIYHFFSILILYFIIYLFDSDKVFFQEDSATPANVLLVILFAFGVGTIPLSYMLSFFFDKTSTGFAFLVIAYLLFGFIVNFFWSAFDFAIHYFNLKGLGWTQDLLYIIRIVPIFSMLYGYQKLFKATSFMNMCKQLNSTAKLASICENEPIFLIKGCCRPQCEANNTCYDSGSFSYGNFGSGWEITYLFLTGIMYFILLIIYENWNQSFHKFLSSLLRRVKKSSNKTSLEEFEEDSDVIEERTRVKHMIEGRIANDEALTVYDLTKYFGSFKAVDHLCFTVHHQECFGLLGVNGAGKTTTFSMLTGDSYPDEGCAYINDDISLVYNLKQFQTNIGYCPQFDCLLDNLSGEETLYMIGRLRGVPAANLARDVSNLVKMVDLQNHVMKPTHTLSGGNKRKLTLAVSLIGSPSLLFLDEPTTGVDPSARRKLWRTLETIKSNFHCSIVLTSHSMDECEALCSRIGIMVAGKFRCLGSTQHLRSKYGQGYTILVRLKRKHESDEEYFENVKQQLSKCIPSAKLTDSHQCLMSFYVSDNSIKWSQLFERMTQLDQKLNFEDFVISDATLESIFIKFAQSQVI